MKIDFIPLANVPTVESLTDSAKVLVIDSGEVKKTAKSNIGGGGSSDFSTATMTVTGLQDNDEININGPVAYDSEDRTSSLGSISCPNGTYNIILYKGYAEVYKNDDYHTAVITGSYDDENQLATGDITVTVTGTT